MTGPHSQPPAQALFRVIEARRGSDGRLTKQGQIWHADINQVRRFGRAIAANSVSNVVLIADSAGNVLEELKVPDTVPAGWSGWRDLVLPPLPPAKKRKKPALTLRAPPPPAAPAPLPPPTPAPSVQARVPVDLPVVDAAVAAMEDGGD